MSRRAPRRFTVIAPLVVIVCLGLLLVGDHRIPVGFERGVFLRRMPSSPEDTPLFNSLRFGSLSREPESRP